MKKTKICLTTLILLSILLTLFIESYRIRKVYAGEIDDAISDAQSYLDRAYHEINSTHAVCKEYASIPFRVYDDTNNYWLPLSKQCADVDSIARFKGGCKVEHIKTGHAFVSGDNNERWYRWDNDADYSFDDLVLWCEDSSAANTQIWMHVVVKEIPSATFDLYLGDTKIIDDCSKDDGYTTTKTNGWFSQRYPLRHATRLMQWYYEDRGNSARKNKLKNTMDDIGYTIEFYAPLWNKSLNYADSWVSWSQNKTIYPDPKFWGTINDNFWNDQAIPYHSNIGENIPRNGFLLYVSNLGNPIFYLARWIHLLNKYPNDQNLIEDIEDEMDKIEWNGYGISGFLTRTQLWHGFGAYNSYSASLYGYACARLYELTSKQFWKYRAEDVAGVLLQLRLKSGETTYCDGFGEVYRADSVGGFLITYGYNGTYYFRGSSVGFVAKYGLALCGALGIPIRDPDEYQCAILTNTETTLLCWKYLKYFDSLNLTPHDKTEFEEWNGDTDRTWTTDKWGVSEVCKAYKNNFIEMWMDSYGEGTRWCTATLTYTFKPANTSISLNIEFWYRAYYRTNYGGYARLRLKQWIKDLDDNNNEVWSDTTQIFNKNSGYGVLREIVNKTWSPSHTFNKNHEYKWYIKFDADTYYYAELDMANHSPSQYSHNHTTCIRLEEFTVRD